MGGGGISIITAPALNYNANRCSARPLVEISQAETAVEKERRTETAHNEE